MNMSMTTPQRLINYSDIKAFNPCWDDARLRTGVGAGLTAAQIAASTASSANKRWVLSRLLASTAQGQRLLVAIVTGYATDAVLRSCPDNEAAWCAIGAASAFAAGEGWATSGVCTDAADAAYAASSSSAASAAARAAYAAYAACAAAIAAANAAYAVAADYAADAAAFINDMALSLDWLLSQ